MSQPYHGRHRNAATPGRTASRSSGLTRALRRPAVTSSLLLAVVATTAAGYQATDQHQTGAAGLHREHRGRRPGERAVRRRRSRTPPAWPPTATTPTRASPRSRRRTARRPSPRPRPGRPGPPRGAPTRRPATRPAGPGGQEAGAGRQRPAGPARRGPGDARRVRLRREPVELPGQPLDGRERLELHRRQLLLGRLRHPAVAARLEDGVGVGADWQTNPVTQIRWGLQYIKSSYGSPCNAWSHLAVPLPALVLSQPTNAAPVHPGRRSATSGRSGYRAGGSSPARRAPRRAAPR